MDAVNRRGPERPRLTPTSIPTMDHPTRLAALDAAYALIASLITDEEAELYPVLDHFADLIADLRIEAEPEAA